MPTLEKQTWRRRRRRRQERSGKQTSFLFFFLHGRRDCPHYLRRNSVSQCGIHRGKIGKWECPRRKDGQNFFLRFITWRIPLLLAFSSTVSPSRLPFYSPKTANESFPSLSFPLRSDKGRVVERGRERKGQSKLLS